MPIKSILMVTHNIEEAVLMCDRILVLSSNPGRIAAEIKVSLQHPRNRLDPEFRQLVDQIYALMTQPRRAKPPGPRRRLPGPRPRHGAAARLHQHARRHDRGGRRAALRRQGRSARARRLVCSSRSTNSSPSPRPCNCCASPNSRRATSSSRPPASASSKWTSTSARSCSATTCCPMCRSPQRISSVLDERPSHHAPATRFREELEDYMCEDYAETTLKSVIDLGPLRRAFRLRRGHAVVQPREPAVEGRGVNRRRRASTSS